LYSEIITARCYGLTNTIPGFFAHEIELRYHLWPEATTAGLNNQMAASIAGMRPKLSSLLLRTVVPSENHLDTDPLV